MKISEMAKTGYMQFYQNYSKHKINYERNLAKILYRSLTIQQQIKIIRLCRKLILNQI